MKVVIETSFPVRDRMTSIYYSYPVYTPHIEETMIRELEFLKQYKTFTLTMTVKREENNGINL